MKFWLFVAAIIAVVWWLKNKTNGSDTESISWQASKSDSPDRNEKVQISKNIYGAVETFATLCHMWKKQTGWAYESLDFASIEVKYSGDRVSLKMKCRGDCMAIYLTDSFPELSADSDNIVVYNSSEVHSLNADKPEALWEAFKDGSPNAVLQNISATPGHIFINIGFEN